MRVKDRWKPIYGEGVVPKTIMTVSASGYMTYWNAMTGKCISSTKDVNGADLYCIDYNRKGTEFAVGGNDHAVKVYDSNKQQLITTLKTAGIEIGHANRVFSVHFADDPNMLISGGWDNAIFFWDIRLSHSLGNLFGPRIYGDSLAIDGNVLLTGSYNNADVLQLWDIKERKLIETIPWEPLQSTKGENGYLYTVEYAKPSPLRKYFAAGGAGDKAVKIFRNEPGHELLTKIPFTKSITSIDFAYGKRLVAVVCNDGSLNAYSFEDPNVPPE